MYIMIDMVVCGLMIWYHVDCIEFQFFDLNPMVLRDPNGTYYDAMSQHISNNFGIIDIFWHEDHDKCGNSVMGHEYQRFHQNRWDKNFCN